MQQLFRIGTPANNVYVLLLVADLPEDSLLKQRLEQSKDAPSKKRVEKKTGAIIIDGHVLKSQVVLDFLRDALNGRHVTSVFPRLYYPINDAMYDALTFLRVPFPYLFGQSSSFLYRYFYVLVNVNNQCVLILADLFVRHICYCKYNVFHNCPINLNASNKMGHTNLETAITSRTIEFYHETIQPVPFTFNLTTTVVFTLSLDNKRTYRLKVTCPEHPVVVVEKYFSNSISRCRKVLKQLQNFLETC